MTQNSVLVVDDDAANLESLSRIFEREGYRVLTANSGRAAIDVCRLHPVDVMLTDLMMPSMNGIELLRAVRAVAPDVEVVVMTAFGTIEKAVEAMREGALDFVEKPLKRASIVKSIAQACERKALVHENRSLKNEIAQLKSESSREKNIVGNSPALRRTLDIVFQAAKSTASVLVLGESGTGKELLARTIHERSGRRGAFVGVNLAALPESILEGELFGYERGAFTGAIQKREGRIAQAEAGTLFLDEIGELSAASQVKLLRVLQEGEFEPLGGRTRKADFRLIAATNKDLLQLVREGRFREDLYYRLHVIAVTSPPLRDRPSDVPLLVDHFLHLFAARNGRGAMQVAPAAMEKLVAYGWPGNVRELENAIERAVVLARGSILDVDAFGDPVAQAEAKAPSLAFGIGTPLEEIERRVILQTLDYTHGDKQLAAQLLGISLRTIYRKMAGDPSGVLSTDPGNLAVDGAELGIDEKP